MICRRGPVLFATNSTQKNDFMAFRWVMMKAGLPCVTVTKAKNYHDPVMRFLLRRLGVVPLASKGYFLLLDFTEAIGRRPDDAEYRALRDHLDHGARLPEGEPYDTLTSRPRALLDHRLEPAVESYRDFLQRIYARSLAETLRLPVRPQPPATTSRCTRRGPSLRASAAAGRARSSSPGRCGCRSCRSA